jgi:phosphoglycolate phosphatase
MRRMLRGREGAVLFDLDGVLVDSRVAITSCITHALATHGLTAHAPEALERFIGPPLARTFAELTASPPDGPLVLACLRSYRERYAAVWLRETTVVPGIADALADLGRDHRLAVATSKPLAFAEPLITALGLRHFFAVVSGPELDAYNEDKAATIARAISALGTEGAVMVGDRSHDMVGARANGLRSVGVAWGVGDGAELRTAGADAIVETRAGLPRAVRLLMPATRAPAPPRPSQ